MAFAKIFETKEHGQLCALMDDTEDGRPSIKVHCHPEGQGVCSNSLIFSDTDEGWVKQQEVFDELTEDMAINVVKLVFEMAEAMSET